MKRVQWIWAGLCLGGIVVFGLGFESEEAHCRAIDGFLCFDTGVAFAVVAVVGLVVWVVVALVLSFANWALRQRARR